MLACSFFDYKKKKFLVDLIQSFRPEVLYLPFGLMWSNFVYRRLHKNIRIVKENKKGGMIYEIFANFSFK